MRANKFFFSFIILASLFAGYVLCLFTRVEAKANAPVSYAADSVVAPPIDSCVKTFSQNGIEETKAGWQFWYIRKNITGDINLKKSHVEKTNATHAPHQHKAKEIFYVVTGKAVFYMNGESRTVGPNTALYCPAYVMHGISRANDEPLEYMVFKAE